MASHDTTVPQAAPDLSKRQVGEQIGPYIVQKVLARGGLGATFLCRHSISGKRAVVKTFPAGTELEPGFAQRCQLTREKLINFKHPNILGTRLIEFDQGGVYAVLDFLDPPSGLCSLQDKLDERGSLPEKAVLNNTLNICKALMFAHACRGGIIHGNFKPSNILFSQRKLMVSEFALLNLAGPQHVARIIRQAMKEMEKPNANHSVRETYLYMSPEQLRGESVTPQSNLYSLGLIMYHSLTGKHYTPSSPPASSFGVSPKWDPILERCLQPDPAQRYARADELYADLRRAFLMWRIVFRTLTPALLILSIIGVLLYLSMVLTDFRSDFTLPFSQWQRIRPTLHAQPERHADALGYVPLLHADALDLPLFPVDSHYWAVRDLDLVFAPIGKQTFLAMTELTQAQYLAVMHDDPSLIRSFSGDEPVNNLTFAQAEAFCKALTLRERQAGRLSSTFAFSVPNIADYRAAVFPAASRIALPGDVDTQRAIIEVGKHPPLKSDIYDLDDNVYEWVYAPSPAYTESRRDENGTYRFELHRALPSFAAPAVGFRVVLKRVAPDL